MRMVAIIIAKLVSIIATVPNQLIWKIIPPKSKIKRVIKSLLQVQVDVHVRRGRFASAHAVVIIALMAVEIKVIYRIKKVLCPLRQLR